MYTEIRLYISNPSATLTDGTKIQPIIPGKANIVRVVQPFSVTAGQNTNLTMDFDAQNSIIKAGNKYILKPVVAHLLESKTGASPSGQVSPTPPLPKLSGIPSVLTPPPGCYYRVCTIACPATNPNCCPKILVCPSGTASPVLSSTTTPFPTCIPRPSCLDASPACALPAPTQGWCPPTGKPLTGAQSNTFLFYLNSFLRSLRAEQ